MQLNKSVCTYYYCVCVTDYKSLENYAVGSMVKGTLNRIELKRKLQEGKFRV